MLSIASPSRMYVSLYILQPNSAGAHSFFMFLNIFSFLNSFAAVSEISSKLGIIDSIDL